MTTFKMNTVKPVLATTLKKTENWFTRQMQVKSIAGQKYFDLH